MSFKSTRAINHRLFNLFLLRDSGPTYPYVALRSSHPCVNRAVTGDDWSPLDISATYSFECVGANGLTVVAFGLFTTRNAISYDGGLTWTIYNNLPSAGTYLFIRWIPELSLWVAGGNVSGSGARIITSSNGITWTTRYTVSPSSTYFNGIAWNGSALIASTTATSGTMFHTSTDGITWTPLAATVPSGFGAYPGLIRFGSLLLIGGIDSTATARIFKSINNGLTWTGAFSNGAILVTGSCASPSRALFAFNTNVVVYTDDGVTFTQRSLVHPGYTPSEFPIYKNNRFLVIYTQGKANFSNDGHTWNSGDVYDMTGGGAYSGPWVYSA